MAKADCRGSDLADESAGGSRVLVSGQAESQLCKAEGDSCIRMASKQGSTGAFGRESMLCSTTRLGGHCKGAAECCLCDEESSQAFGCWYNEEGADTMGLLAQGM